MTSVHSGLLMAEKQFTGFTDRYISAILSTLTTNNRERQKSTERGSRKYIKGYDVRKTAVGRDGVLPNEFHEGVSDEFGRVCNFAPRLIEGLSIEEDVSDIPD